MTRLSEVLEHENYQKADPDKKRLILEDWYDFTIKSDPDYDSASDENIRTVIFRDVPPTHIQKTPSLLQELPKALGEVFLPKPKPDSTGTAIQFPKPSPFEPRQEITIEDLGRMEKLIPPLPPNMLTTGIPKGPISVPGQIPEPVDIFQREQPEPTPDVVSQYMGVSGAVKQFKKALEAEESMIGEWLFGGRKITEVPEGAGPALARIKAAIFNRKNIRERIEQKWPTKREVSPQEKPLDPDDIFGDTLAKELLAEGLWFTKPSSWIQMVVIGKGLKKVLGLASKNPTINKILKTDIFAKLKKTDLEKAAKTLGVKTNASFNKIKQAYRTKAMATHPDLGGTEESFQAVKNAYNTLFKARNGELILKIAKAPKRITGKVQPTPQPTKAIEAFKPIVKAPALPKSGVAQVDRAIASVAKTPGIKLDTLKKTLTGDIIGNMTPIAGRKATPGAIKSALTKLENVKAAIKADDIDNLGMYNIYKPTEKPKIDIFKPKEVAPKAPVSLEAEAKKYKTAEEFVEKQPKVYHQSQSKEDFEAFKQKGDMEYRKAYYSQAGEGIYFSPNKELVQSKYGKEGGKLVEAVLQPKKPLDLGDKDAMYFSGKKINEGEVVVENFKRSQRGEKELGEPDIVLTNITKKAKKWLTDKGYDSVTGMKGEMWSAPETVVLDPSIIKTKPELESIYEQAHKPEVKAFEPKKAKVEAFKPREPKVKAEILPEGEISIPVKKPVYKPTQTLSGEVKAKLKEQKGAVVIAGEPLKAVKTTMDKVADVFTRYRNIDDITREQFVAIEELAPKKMEDAADLAMQTVGNKFDKATRRKIQLAMDNPSKYTLPKGTEKVTEEIDKIQKLHNQTLKEAGFDISEWPQGKIKYLEEQIPELETKLKTLKTDKAKGNTREKIDATKKEIEQLKGLGYVHRISRKTLVGKIRGATKLRSISTKPVKFLGRHYNTIEEAEKAGIIVGDITESVGETIYSIWKTAETKNLIDAINKNKNYTLPTDKAPSDWESIDPRVLPSAKGKKYHPAMAGAIKELTYVSRDVNALVRAYDNINTTGKMIGFYNPIFMTNYDIQQGWRAAGMKFFTGIPSAIKTYVAKDDKYYQLMKEGIFNKVIDYKPGVDVMVKQMLDMAEKSYGKRFAEKLGDVLLHPVKGLQIFNNKTTWAMDEILRIAAREGIKNQRVTKGLSSFQITDLANDFMAAYNKLPKATKKTLNRVIFTPTYKISMARILGKMHANPKQFTAPLIRHHAFKLFLKFVLPTVVGSYVANKYKDEITKVYSEKGYRLVVKIGDKVEKVYAITGPLLEETKIAHRKLAYTLKLNLSFGLNMLNTFLNRNKGYSEPDDLKRINEYFKIGAPGIREYQNWTDKDKATADKFLSQLGFAYAYTRLPSAKEPDKRNIFIKALSAMDLWLDWRDKEETRELKEVERRYRWYSDKLYRAIKRKDNPEIRELMEKSRKEFGKYYPIKNVEARIAREKRVKKPWLTRGEQQLEAKNKFIQGVIREK